MGPAPGRTLGPDLNGKWAISPWNCSLGFPWPVWFFFVLIYFFLFLFLITWFWIDQQTCLFAQLDLNWLLVQTSGGFSVWLCSSLSRKTSSPIFSIFADREPAGLLFESTSECTVWPKKKKKDHSFRFVEFGCFIFGHSASLSCCFTFLWNSLFCGSFSKFSLHCQLLWTNGRQPEFCSVHQYWNLKHLCGVPHTEILSLEDCVLKTELSLTLLNQSILHLSQCVSGEPVYAPNKVIINHYHSDAVSHINRGSSKQSTECKGYKPVTLLPIR